MFRPSFLLVPLTPCDLVTGCALHPGFFIGWGEISADVQTALASAVALHGSYAIVVTGHSLGGAIATIAGAYLRNNGYSLDLYTYGSPRVGNLAFVSLVSNQPGGAYRTTHADDAAAHVLNPTIVGYRHTSPEYWIDPTDARGTVTPASVTVCVGYMITTCNEGTFALLTGAHTWYFQPIGSCPA